ncbi:MAG: helix-turn-helix domain-containing protein [Spirochaetales bacterium]
MAKNKELNPYLKNVDAALHRIGKTRAWLSRECGFSPSMITNLFFRNNYPSVNNAWTISTVLGYPLDEMLKGDIQTFQPVGKSKRELMTTKVLAMCKELDENELETFLPVMRGIVDLRRLA